MNTFSISRKFTADDSWRQLAWSIESTSKARKTIMKMCTKNPCYWQVRRGRKIQEEWYYDGSKFHRVKNDLVHNADA